ncbi:hypothetical protein SSP35_01_06260 [Streptomyces sp. NBRC 110611]|nr:hypothetical protein [Streptomyces sp. NBRC 110611]GAU65288.1 hypothetical protein SSP35_01_06260 [Streptomyces sp. NBRC 110611]
MSLPVTRRIARAALLVAAGAAPVVAAAGSASAAELPAKAPGLGGLTAPLDSQNTSKSLNHGTRDGVDVVNATSKAATQKLAPAAGETATPAMKKTMPLTNGVVGKVEGAARPLVKDGVSTNTLPKSLVKVLHRQARTALEQPHSAPARPGQVKGAPVRTAKAPAATQHAPARTATTQHGPIHSAKVQNVPAQGGKKGKSPAAPVAMVGGLPVGLPVGMPVSPAPMGMPSGPFGGSFGGGSFGGGSFGGK